MLTKKEKLTAERQRANVIGAHVDIVNWKIALRSIWEWGKNKESRYVCITNVHSLVTAAQDAGFSKVLEAADLATPDGAPVAWMMRRLGFAEQQRINGPDLMWRYCEQAAARHESIYLLGATPVTLDQLQKRLALAFPGLRIAGAESPPFRLLTATEDAAIVTRINASGTGTVWVSLGCPKQELWMAAHRGQVQAVMIGVGAAFDYHAGTVRRAPGWMQNAGLEWLYRLASEPRRLWRRYLITNSIFIWAAARQLWRRGTTH
jgi:N-acetylglucosaminyldiphosphoundecaprenol N-acetyl-beta-D-mannosaminyltransferase